MRGLGVDSVTHFLGALFLEEKVMENVMHLWDEINLVSCNKSWKAPIYCFSLFCVNSAAGLVCGVETNRTNTFCVEGKN